MPSPEAEDARHLHRELLTLKSDRTRVTNRIKGRLAAQGLSVASLGPGFLDKLDGFTPTPYQSGDDSFDRLAERSGRSRSEIVREALRRQLAVSQLQDLRKRMMPFAEAAGYLTDEDVFRDIS